MVCTYFVQYQALSTDVASAQLSWKFNFDPPEEIAGKACILKLVHGETSQVLVSGAYVRIPLIVQIPSITQRFGRETIQFSNVEGTSALENIAVGFMAVNDTGGIINPSIQCFIPDSPQSWDVKVEQCFSTTAYIGASAFYLGFFLQITPIE